MRAANTIHPTAVLSGDIQMGADNVIGAFCVLEGPIVLGDGNRIGPHAVIGTAGDEIWRRRQHTTGKRIQIGSRGTIREHVTIHKPVYGDLTTIGDDVYLMHGAYVAHDVILGNGAILAQNAAVGGVSRVLEGGYVAMGAALHQQTVCGPYAIISAAAAAVRCVRPFTRHIPGQSPTLNAYAIERYGFDAHREEVEQYVADRVPPPPGRVADLVADYEEHAEQSGRGEY